MSFRLRQGRRPLLISMPHIGTELPKEFARNMHPRALVRADTDWHVARLYDFVREWDISVLQAQVSRYVIDLNRPPDGASLYPGGQTTELCPTTTFAGEALYADGAQPDAAAIACRLTRYWQPYHAALQQELLRLGDTHKQMVLFEAHSIRSHLPRLFPGRLSDLNLGTFSGRACACELQTRVEAYLCQQQAYTVAVNERFKGGYITRAYGQPDGGVHALQLELAQSSYMDETAPFRYDSDKASRLQPLLQGLLKMLLHWAETGKVQCP